MDARTHPHPYTAMKDNLKETEEALIDEALKKIYAVSGDPNKKNIPHLNGDRGRKSDYLRCHERILL
jgi:hypothetical protein